MNAFTDGLRITKDGLGRGLHSIASTVEHGLNPSDNLLSVREAQPPAPPPSQPSSNTAPAPVPPPPPPPPSSLLTSLTSTTSTLLSTPTTAATAAATSLATTTRSATTTGLSITSSIARSGLDAGADVVSLTTGTAALAGTALGGVVAAAAETSGAVFEPVGASLKTLKALEGLEHLEHGVQVVNGLSLAAVKNVSELTSKALNMSGKTPTFFDHDADGIVRIPDTVRGLVLLGLDEKNATYAAYALHTVFSYSTSESWVPAIDKSLPIHVSNMSRTKWGKNWGNFERLEWVDDVEIDKFFVQQKSQKSLSDYWKQGRQGFGILLLLFEWGTTWPFYMPSLSVPVHQIPFADDIGSVVRKAILPTIVSNFKQARMLNPQPPEVQKPPRVPEDPINMPGEYTG